MGGRKRRMADARRAEIVKAARELCERQGLAHTTIKDIADKVGVTRSLFYHYFPDKEAVVDAVLDDIVSDFLAELKKWNDARERGKIDKALSDVLVIFRSCIFENNSFRRSLASYENAGLYLRFMNMVADAAARFFVENTVRDFERYHDVEIDHVYETFYVLIVGLVGYLRTHPDADPELLKSIAAHTLHIERYIPSLTPSAEDWAL